MARYIYGPVPSRRLGLSLGVDLVPMKTCTFNCVYCQLGPTAQTTMERADYTPPDEVAAEVIDRIGRAPRPDWVTLGGSGEPTLHASFGEIARRIAADSDIPLSLLTNGSLMMLPEVRRACEPLSLILPSLDAGTEQTFRRVNRPHPDLTLAGVVAGLEALRDEFDGEIWLEVFLVAGMNDSDREIAQMKAHIARVRPDRVQLNTAVRPPAEEDVRALSAERLEEVRAMLGPTAEVVAEVEERVRREAGAEAGEQQVLEMLERRPCTLEDISAGLGIAPNEVLKYVQSLLEQDRLLQKREGGRIYYCGK